MSEFLRNFEAGYRQVIGAFNAGDLDTVFAGIPEEIEFHVPAQVGEGPFRGRDRWRAFVERMRDRHPDWRVEPLEFSEPREGIVLIRTEVSGSQSLPVSGEVWQVWEFEGGVVKRVRELTDRAEAATAARGG